VRPRPPYAFIQPKISSTRLRFLLTPGHQLRKRHRRARQQTDGDERDDKFNPREATDAHAVTPEASCAIIVQFCPRTSNPAPGVRNTTVSGTYVAVAPDIDLDRNLVFIDAGQADGQSTAPRFNFPVRHPR
jgi:hypothetical protein